MILTMTEKFDENIPGVNYIGKARFDNAFFEKYIPNVREVSRFILCGPPPMVENAVTYPQVKRSFNDSFH